MKVLISITVVLSLLFPLFGSASLDNNSSLLFTLLGSAPLDSNSALLFSFVGSAPLDSNSPLLFPFSYDITILTIDQVRSQDLQKRGSFLGLLIGYG